MFTKNASNKCEKPKETRAALEETERRLTQLQDFRRVKYLQACTGASATYIQDTALSLATNELKDNHITVTPDINTRPQMSKIIGSNTATQINLKPQQEFYLVPSPGWLYYVWEKTEKWVNLIMNRINVSGSNLTIMLPEEIAFASPYSYVVIPSWVGAVEQPLPGINYLFAHKFTITTTQTGTLLLLIIGVTD